MYVCSVNALKTVFAMYKLQRQCLQCKRHNNSVCCYKGSVCSVNVTMQCLQWKCYRSSVCPLKVTKEVSAVRSYNSICSVNAPQELSAVSTLRNEMSAIVHVTKDRNVCSVNVITTVSAVGMFQRKRPRCMCYKGSINSVNATKAVSAAYIMLQDVCSVNVTKAASAV